MKKHILLAPVFAFLFCFSAQSASAQAGTVYGTNPSPAMVVSASKLASYMDKKARLTVGIRGKVLKVTNTRGGWFEIDAGNGQIISAHFRDYKVNIPISLAGKTIVAEGIAAKQFLAAAGQHFAGAKKAASTNTPANEKLTYEVTGLKVE